MTSLTVTFLFLALINAARTQPEPHVSSNVFADISSYPFLASIWLSGNYVCGGTIISNKTILTAAHCFDNIGSRSVSVRVGSAWKNEATSYTAETKTLHSQYNIRTNDNDVAIIKTTNQMAFGKYVKIATLATTLPAAGSEVYVIGWGTYAVGSPTSAALRIAWLELKSEEDCTETDYYTRVTKNIICANNLNRWSACPGDSGGPIVDALTRNVVGVISFGWCNSSKGVVGMPVPVYYDWINNNK